RGRAPGGAAAAGRGRGVGGRRAGGRRTALLDEGRGVVAATAGEGQPGGKHNENPDPLHDSAAIISSKLTGSTSSLISTASTPAPSRSWRGAVASTPGAPS